MRILVIETAGFIAHTLAKKPLGRGDQVVRIDNFNYEPDAKLTDRIGEFVTWYKLHGIKSFMEKINNEIQ